MDATAGTVFAVSLKLFIDKWASVASMATALYGLAAATGADGRIYAVGGNTPGGTTATVVAYVP